MSKHTQGPWLPVFGEAYAVRAKNDGSQVAIMTNLKGHFGLGGRRTGDEVAANTYLIASAPKLIEMLQKVSMNAVYVSDGECSIPMQIVKEVDVVIAEALGLKS